MIPVCSQGKQSWIHFESSGEEIANILLKVVLYIFFQSYTEARDISLTSSPKSDSVSWPRCSVNLNFLPDERIFFQLGAADEKQKKKKIL